MPVTLTLCKIECLNVWLYLYLVFGFSNWCMKFTYRLSCTFLPFLLILINSFGAVCAFRLFACIREIAHCVNVFFVFVEAAVAARQKSRLCVGKHTEIDNWSQLMRKPSDLKFKTYTLRSFARSTLVCFSFDSRSWSFFRRNTVQFGTSVNACVN